jgi:tetratricopeptide (TPR) repeat protein
MDGHLTADHYEVAALDLAKKGNYPLAFVQMATALSSNPLDTKRLRIADSWLTSHADALMNLSEHADFFGVIALRARLHAHRRQVSQALALLLQVVAFRPDVPYLAWLGAWQDLAWGECNLDEVGPSLAAFVQALGPSISATPGRRVNAQHASVLVRQLLSAHRGHEQLTVLGITLLRRLDEEEAALKMAVSQFEAVPSWRIAVTAANAYRGAGRLDEALSYYQRAVQLEPQHVTTYLDLGDLHVTQRRYDKALEAYSAALQLEPANLWARAAGCITLARWKPTPESQREARAWENHEQIGQRLRALFELEVR